MSAAKPITVICHGPWMLINAGGVAGRTMTSWPSLQAEPVQRRRPLGGRDGGQGRQAGHLANPQAPPACCKAIVALFAETA